MLTTVLIFLVVEAFLASLAFAPSKEPS